MAAANGYTDVLEFLLSQEEVNINIQDNEGWTAFHGAVCWGQVRTVAGVYMCICCHLSGMSILLYGYTSIVQSLV